MFNSRVQTVHIISVPSHTFGLISNVSQYIGVTVVNSYEGGQEMVNVYGSYIENNEVAEALEYVSLNLGDEYHDREQDSLAG